MKQIIRKKMTSKSSLIAEEQAGLPDPRYYREAAYRLEIEDEYEIRLFHSTVFGPERDVSVIYKNGKYLWDVERKILKYMISQDNRQCPECARFKALFKGDSVEWKETPTEKKEKKDD